MAEHRGGDCSDGAGVPGGGQGGFHPTDPLPSPGLCSGIQSDTAMNNTCFIFLIRRDHVLGLAAHLAAGILALVLLTGAARTKAPGTDAPAVASVTTLR